MSKLQFNLSLAGGGAYGLSYLGALKFFEENKDKLWIKRITGTSIGAIIASVWSCGLNHRKVIQILKDLKLSDLSNITGKGNIFKKALYLAYSNLILSDNIRRALNQNLKWENVNIPLVVCATDVPNLKPVYFDSSNKNDISLGDAVYSSMCIPMVFRSSKINNTYLFDGMFFDNNCNGILKYNEINSNILLQPFKNTMIQPSGKSSWLSKWFSIIECMILAGEYNSKDKFGEIVDIHTGAENILDFSDKAISNSVDVGYSYTKKYFDSKIMKYI